MRFSRAGAILLPLVLGGHLNAAPLYQMVDLGTLGGTFAAASHINDSGTITGNSKDASGNEYAFVYANGQMASLGTDNGLVPLARNINASGQIEGNLSNGDLFVWSNGTFTDIPLPAGDSHCRGNGFNDSGEITGQITVSTGQILAFLYNPANGGSFTTIGTMGGKSTDFSYGSSINDSGQIEGDSINSNGLDHAFIWTNGSFQDLGTFGGPASSGVKINNQGHASGTSQTPGDASSDLFFYNGTTMIDGGTLGGDFANANDMNDNDEIVGSSYLSDNTTEDAFVYLGSKMYDLNNLVPPDSGWTFTAATGVNNSGDIVADAVDANGDEHAFLLTPLPEPASLACIATTALFMTRRPAKSRSGRES